MTTLIIIVTVMIFLIFATGENKTTKSSKTKFDDPFYQKFNTEGHQLIKDLEKYYLGVSYPENFPSKDYFVQFLSNVTELQSMNYENLLPLVGLNTPNPTFGSDEYKAQKHFQNLIETLTFRKNADEDENYSGSGEQEVAEKHNINLYKDEVLILTNGFTKWKEEKTRTTGISYGGIRMSSGRGGLKTVLGHMNITRHQETFFDTFDTGTTFITNKRIIFVGSNNRNKSIRMDRIVNVEIFEDGIYIGKENGVSPIITTIDLWENEDEPWSFSHQLTSRIPEMATYINRVLHNDVTVVVE